MTTNIDKSAFHHLGEHGYYVGLWVLDGRGGNFMAILHRPADATDLRLDTRFRYYKDDRVFNSEDERSEIRADLAGKTETEAIAIVDEMIAHLVKAGYLGTRLPWAVKKRSTRRLIRGDGRAFLRAIADLPMLHVARADDHGNPIGGGRSLNEKHRGKGN